MLKQNEIQAMIDDVVARVMSQVGQSEGAAESVARVLQDRVITTAQVPNENECGSVVIVRQDAVITPAAKDLFRDRGIRFQHVPVKAGQSGRTNLSGELLVVGCESTKYEVLNSRLGGSQPYDCVVKASAMAAVKCRQGGRVVVIAAAPEVAVIALSRHESVRPVEVVSLDHPQDVQQRIDSTAANVLVISDSLATHWRVVRVVEAFIQQEFAAIPAWL